MDRDILESKGALALKRLFDVANRDSGQCRYIAHFLLGLYNGQRFPFDLTDMRALDDSLFEDCMAVLRMDARVTQQEVHQYFDNGGKRFEQLAKYWQIEDMAQTRERAQLAPVPAGTPAPLHEGGSWQAKLRTYGDAPGYRDTSIYVMLGEGDNTEVELRLSPADAESVMMHIARLQVLAWGDPRGPLDQREGEKRPAWLGRAPAQW